MSRSFFEIALIVPLSWSTPLQETIPISDGGLALLKSDDALLDRSFDDKTVDQNRILPAHAVGAAGGLLLDRRNPPRIEGGNVSATTFDIGPPPRFSRPCPYYFRALPFLMTRPETARNRLDRILLESDPVARQLLLAALVSELFRERGFEPVVVGGSAIEFYTEGAYVSGDIDLTFDSARLPSPAERAEVMAGLLGATGNTRTWKIGDCYLDLLGMVEAFATGSFRTLETPEGRLTLQPVEDLLAERVFIARGMGQPNDEAESCARKLIAFALANPDAVDWSKAEEIADSAAYRCGDELRAMRTEVSEEIR